VQYRLRSIVLVTLATSVICALLVSTPKYPRFPPLTLLFWVTAFLIAWTVPGASLGLDNYRTRRGLVGGALLGFGVGTFFLALILLNH
jgi:hypothetical protein